MSTIFATAKQSFSCTSFKHLAESLLNEGKTTGDNQSENYLFYAKLNLQRMHRWEKTFELRDDIRLKIKSLPPQKWWVITEGWCGDSAQNLPAIAKMADVSEGKITLCIVLRDDNPQIMNQYLTNGASRSIPILVALNQEDTLLFRWGPRPQAAQLMLNNWKNNPVPSPFEEFEKEMHTWYSRDKGKALQDEMISLL